VDVDIVPDCCIPRQTQGYEGRLVTRHPDELHPHPAYIRHQLTVSASKLSALLAQDGIAFQEPLAITRDGTIIDGYARWELARRQHRRMLPCIEHDLTTGDALLWLLRMHCRRDGINDFCRILLALEFESSYRERALLNQRIGGKEKALSNLTKADRVEVRREIAAIAQVSVGNVTKVKQLMVTAQAELLQALSSGEISIHWAWKCSSESPESQRSAVRRYRQEKGVNKAIRDLMSRHERRGRSPAPDLRSLARRLLLFEADNGHSVNVLVLGCPGKAVFVTEELLMDLPPYQEALPI